jgi:hypothetical protein
MSETLFALWIGLSVAMLLLFMYAAMASLRNRHRNPVALDDLIPSFLPVDVEEFAELVGSAPDQQIGAPCGKGHLRLQRDRTAQTMEVLRRMAHNAALLQRLGYSQLQSSNPLISDLAQQMIDAGVHVRLYTFVGLVIFRLCSVFRVSPVQIMPATRIAELQHMMSGSLLPAYEQLKDKAGNLTCLKFSGLHEALAQSL